MSPGSSSVALDAYCAGSPVIVFLVYNNFNFSNLYGIEGVEFSGFASELIEALIRIETGINATAIPEDFFWLDPDLPGWKSLLEIK